MATSRQPGHDFADRFDHALNLAGVPRGRLRTGKVAAMFYVSRETARLWLKGRMPAFSKLREIARRLEVALDWLATNRGPIRPPVTIGDKNTPLSGGDSVESEIFAIVRLMSTKRKRALLALLTME